MSDTRTSSFPLGQAGFMPQEEMLELIKKQKQLVIGLPKETYRFENRIALTPQAVNLLTLNEHKVIIESDAGKGANYHDKDYSEAGGLVINDKESVYKCDIILKVAPFSLEEINLLKEGQTVISALHVNLQTEETIKRLMQKKVKAIAFEFLKSDNDFYPVMHAISEIIGSTAIMIAAEYLSNIYGGKGVLLGGITGITPTEVLIIGSGTAAEYAARTAMGLGATVKIFDNSIYRLKQFQARMGRPIFTSIFQPKVLIKALKSADVVIGAMDLQEEINGVIITEEMLGMMKKGTVIIDLNVDNRSCFETAKLTDHGSPVFEKHGVIHYCVPNIASRVSRTASIALSNVFTPILLETGAAGGIAQHLKENAGIRHGTYIYNGILTNQFIGKKFGISAKDINLLMAAF
jgi:alanine dehydrogenase